MRIQMVGKILKTDVLIAGAGAAGIRAAQAAKQKGADVLLVGDYPRLNCGSTFSEISKGWGIQALLGAEDSPENRREFRDDILAAGLGQCRGSLVDILVAESSEAIQNLLNHGLRLRKDESGAYIRRPGCFSSVKRAFLTESMENIIRTFSIILDQNRLKIMPGQIVKLIVEDGECCGAIILIDGKQPTVVMAGATILATGGGAGIYEHHLVRNHQVGDGYALAAKAGARIENIEFVQFMLGVTDGLMRDFLPLDHLAGPRVSSIENTNRFLEKAIADDTLRERAVNDRQKHFPFSSRDESYRIDVAIHKVNQEGGEVLGVDLDKRLQNWKVVHFAQAFNGGVWINERAESTIPGLYAAGEVTAGPHGADRIGGCMMTATLVFGKRAGEYGAQRALRHNRSVIPNISIPGDRAGDLTGKGASGGDFIEIETQVKKAMQLYGSVVRSGQGLEKCLAILQVSSDRLERLSRMGRGTVADSFRLRHLITTAKLVTEHALARNCSLGPHFRSGHGDFADVRVYDSNCQNRRK